MPRFKVGDKVVARNDMTTHYADHSTLDAREGYIGEVIATDVYGNPRYYTVDFNVSGGMITDAHEVELGNIN